MKVCSFLIVFIACVFSVLGQATPYPYVREADIMWGKCIWRVVDFRDKINQYLFYPLDENNNRINLITVLQNGIRGGLIIPYDPIEGDDFKLKMNSETALKIGCRIDSIPIYDANPPYDLLGYMADTISFDPFSVKRLKIKEDWFFDMKRSVMEVRIVGICPVMDVFDNGTGEFLYQRDMFWINYNQARNFLSTYKIYNPYNNAQPISYDDAFIKRMFSSLIYKEDNTHDRRIEDYVKGLDALLEAERIKIKLFIFEHDLWEE